VVEQHAPSVIAPVQRTLVAHLDRALTDRWRPGDGPVVLVVDEGLPEPIRNDVVSLLSRRPVVTVELGVEVLGTLDSARVILKALPECASGVGAPGVVVAAGGGATLDACKLAVAGREKPWLLDEVMWRRHSGFLPEGGLQDRPAGQLPLIACGTRPGAAAEVSARVALAPELRASRRLVVGAALAPTLALVDPRWYQSLDAGALRAAVCESLFRIIGPYLVTEVSTPTVDAKAADSIRRLISVGSKFGSAAQLTNHDLETLARTSLWTATGEHTHTWTPAMPGWWCVQNTLVSMTRQPKGAISGLWLSALLDEQPQVPLIHGRDERWQQLQHALGADTLAELDHLAGNAVSQIDPTIWDSVDLAACAHDVLSLWRAHADIAYAGTDGLVALLARVLHA
jgi:hypothetical protein